MIAQRELLGQAVLRGQLTPISAAMDMLSALRKQ
jgi:hypothetical protein